MTTITWKSYDSPVSKTWSSVSYGNGVFIAVTNDATSNINQIIKSTDGINWTPINAPVTVNTKSWQSVTYGNGRFVAVSASDGVTGTVIVSIDNGNNWTLYAAASDKLWKSVTYGDGLFVAISNATSGATDTVMVSTDNGANWTAYSSTAAIFWLSVIYGADTGLFVAVGNDNNIMTSPNGVTWTSRVNPIDGEWKSVTYGNGKFVAFSVNGRSIYSTNGTTWNTGITSITSLSITSVTYGAGLFVAVSAGDGGVTNTVMTSEDGITWTYSNSAAPKRWNSVTYGNGIFVAVAAKIGSTDNTIMSGVISSDICMLADTPVKTDRGIVAIDKINPDIHTIGNKKILAITKTTQDKNYLVCFEANALHINCPSQRTILTPNHEVLYNGKLYKAIHFVGTNNLITKIKYNKERLYNILMEKHNIIEVNNMRIETLHPEHKLAHIYRKDL